MKLEMEASIDAFIWLKKMLDENIDVESKSYREHSEKTLLNYRSGGSADPLDPSAGLEVHEEEARKAKYKLDLLEQLRACLN